MGKMKKNQKEKKSNQPQKPRYTCKSNLFYKETIAPLESKYRQALKAKNYEQASQIYKDIIHAKEEHRLWLHRKELVRIR